MTSPVPTFASSPWRDEILDAILHVGRARPGLTLVVALETDPPQLAGFVRLNTPRPPEGDDADAILADVMSPALSEIAYMFAPEPVRFMAGAGPVPARELVTIVCRDGELDVTPVEEQFVRGWRLTDDSAAIHRGDVYVVTPRGWACLQGGSGAEPYLQIDADSFLPDDDVLEFPPLVDVEALASDPGVEAAEGILAEAFAEAFPELAAPRPRECLVCYVTRMVGQFWCDDTWRFVDHYQKVRAPRATALKRRPWRRDGVCDCAVYELGFDLAEDVEEPVEYGELRGVPVAVHHEWPWPDPPVCRGVGRGSVQPCGLWEPLGRRRR